MFPGVGTVVNVAAVLTGSTIGVLAGHRLPQRTREVVTDGLGLVTILVAAGAATSINDPSWERLVGDKAQTLIVLGAIVGGGLAGSLLGIERRLEEFGGWMRALLRGAKGAGGDDSERARFIDGFITFSLVACVGPLTILGSLSDGLGKGADQLFLKSALDFFASIAFAASLGWGVAASVVSLIAIQGSLTLLGVVLGDVIADGYVAALTTTGGVLLIGVALRLLRIRQVPVGDMLPALLVAPLLTWVVTLFR